MSKIDTVLTDELALIESVLKGYEPSMARNDALRACKAILSKLSAKTEAQPVAQKLWLWQNFVDGKPEYWAFDNPFPIGIDHHDPQTLGEPCGYALFKPSRQGRTDVSEEAVLRAIASALADATLPQQESHQSQLAAEYVRGRNDGWEAKAQQESKLLEAAEKATPLLEAARAVVNSSVHPSSCQGGYYRVPENVWQKLYTAVIQNLQDEVITSDDPIVKIGVLYMKAGSPPLSGTEFLAWCAKYFGPDSDEKYLAEAVSDLLTKEKFSAAIAASKGSAS